MNHRELVLCCKDHLVSGEHFDLLYDTTYDMLVTSPQPQTEKLADYYKSEQYISHNNTRASWLEKTYRQVQRFTLKKKLKQINTLHPQKGTLLDIGAGTGDFLAKAKTDGWQVHGVEPNAQARAIAKTKGLDLEPTLHDSKKERYDVITLWHVLEHVPDLEKQFQQLKQCLQPNGTLIIAVPNYKSFDATYYKKYWAAYDVPRHLWHFSKTSMARLCENHHFKIVATLPMYFDAFYVSLLSEKYKGGAMHFIKAFCIGFLSNSKAFFKTGEYSSLIYVIKH